MYIFATNIIKFVRNEDGIATAWAIGWLILCFSIAGLSIDATNAWKVKQILQTTADMAAHSGGLELGTVGNSEIEAAVIVAANDYATKNMNVARYGDVLVDTDIHVGFWDQENKTFTELQPGDVDIPNAVSVTTRQDGVNSSRVGTFFLRFVGFDAFTVAAESIVESFVSLCEKDGLKAMGKVKMSTQQEFLGRYCVHGETGIDMADLNIYADGTIASMPNLSDCGPDIDHCTDDYNDGIEAALTQDSSQTFGKLLRIDETIENLLNPYSEDIIDLVYIKSSEVIKIPVDEFDASKLVSGSIHFVKCTRPGDDLNMGGLVSLNNEGSGTDSGANTIVKEITKVGVVVVAEGCDFVFDQTIHYEDAVFATDSTSRQTVSGSAGVILGRDDDCTPGGEVAIVTKGDVNFAAQLNAFDLEMTVEGDVHFASLGNNGESIHEGTTVMAGGDINITTQHTFVNCYDTETALDRKYTLRYVK